MSECVAIESIGLERWPSQRQDYVDTKQGGGAETHRGHNIPRRLTISLASSDSTLLLPGS